MATASLHPESGQVFTHMKVAFSMSFLPASFAPPLAYIVINIDPIAFHLGPIAVHWYGLAYVVAITVGMLVLLRWTRGRASTMTRSGASSSGRRSAG